MKRRIGIALALAVLALVVWWYRSRTYEPATSAPGSFIAPKGPAVNSGIAVGDVIKSIDGIDVTGEEAWQLLSAPPGTVITFGLARGATVKITLAAP
jgi:S1-C subfamily serine protease